MKNPVVRVIISVLFAALICQGAWWFLKPCFDRYHTHINGKLTELFLNDTRHDILFIGSSKTHSNIHPGVIDSICSVNSFNAGLDGISLFEYKMILEAYLLRHPAPKMVVLSFDLHSFNGKSEFYDPVQYLPFVKNKVIDTTLSNNGHPTTIFRIFPFLALTKYSDDQKLVEVIKSMLGKNDIALGDFEYKGYLSNSDSVLSNPDFPIQAQNTTPNGLAFFKDIIATCQEKSIQLVVIYPPEFEARIVRLTPNASAILSTIHQISEANNISFFRHDSLQLRNDVTNFRNTGHLNKKGAVVYSQILATQLKELIH
ncbi:MAG TPA: hypothetical protein PL009_00475 [Flavipsychrobacter sp.]|nr:hypothetical protein [Flavipsychrobacter sp.]